MHSNLLNRSNMRCIQLRIHLFTQPIVVMYIKSHKLCWLIWFIAEIHRQKKWQEIARDAFHWWTFHNRPRHGPIYHSMKTSRALFKYAPRYAKGIVETVRADSLASDFY